MARQFFPLAAVALALFVATFPAPAAAQPINLRDPIIDQSEPYLRQVATIQVLRQRGALLPSLVSSQMFPTYQLALAALRASRFGGSVHSRAIAAELETNWVWWTGGGMPTGGEPIQTSLFIHNRTDQIVSGVIVEMADRDCDFRASAAKAFHIISFGANDTLRPNDAALFETTLPTRRGMFASSGGLWCATIVGSF